MFSKACEYAIRATIHITHQSGIGERVSLKAVAKAIDSPVAFTAKILQSLAKDRIILSVKGPTGGYEISKNNRSKITLAKIVTAIDGDRVFKGCGLGLKACDASKPCPLHDRFKLIRDELKEMLEGTTVDELADGLKEGLCFLKQ